MQRELPRRTQTTAVAGRESCGVTKAPRATLLAHTGVAFRAELPWRAGTRDIVAAARVADVPRGTAPAYTTGMLRYRQAAYSHPNMTV